MVCVGVYMLVAIKAINHAKREEKMNTWIITQHKFDKQSMQFNIEHTHYIEGDEELMKFIKDVISRSQFDEYRWNISRPKRGPQVHEICMNTRRVGN